MPWLLGYPREKIEWYPTIDTEKCVKCGMCMNCGKQVYDWTSDGAKVSIPMSCVVGCTTCANLCLGKAISFPNIENVRDVYKREVIWAKVKEQLTSERKFG